MTKVPMFLIMLLCCLTSELDAQSKVQDSVRRIALADAKKFKLNRAELKIFRADKKNNTSDFFKPSANSTNKPELLKDSIYVKTYREKAYQKTVNRRATGYYFMIGGISFIGAATVIFLSLPGG